MKLNFKRLLRGLALPVAVITFGVMSNSCDDLWSEQHPGTYYTSTGETIADYLEGTVEYHGDFSYFIEILKKADLWGQMRTYGTYTCFAPQDSAIQRYIDTRRAEASNDTLRAIFADINSVLENKKVCDTIARNHIFNNLMYTSELNGDGVLQHPNMLDRYVTYNSIADTTKVYDDNNNVIKAKDGSDSTMVRLKYLINMQATLIKADDTVQNGVVHKINQIIRPSNQFIPGLMKENPNLTIFYDAIVVTGFKDTLDQYYDDTYPEIPYDWTEQALRDNYSGIHVNETAYETGSNADRIAIPEKREFKFTVFCMPDSALETYNDEYTAKAGLNGIHDLNDLRAYAKAVYDPEGTGPADETDRNNSLNKLISYHVLPCWLSYDQFNTRQESIIKRRLALKEYDVEDFFETMLPHSVMRISTPYPGGTWQNPLGIFINRNGTQEIGIVAEGTRIAQNASEYNFKGGITNICVNGGYHYINKLLVYDDYTRETALKCRMRIMCCTLSPDFINSRGRGRLNGDPSNGGVTNINKMVMAYKVGYCKNIEWVEDQTKFYVRYRDASFGTVYGDELTVRGSYDLAFKLPPVPNDGTYEIRMWNNSLAGSGRSDRGIVQFYLHQYNPATDKGVNWRSWDWDPQGIPTDLRLGGSDARIGMVPDDDDRYSGMTEAQKDQAIYLNDRAMRIRGYMKALDSYTSGTSSDNTGTPIRNDQACWRKIVCNEYLKKDSYYYIRMRQVFEDDGVFPFSFIEIVPKDIYEGNENRH